MNDFQKELDVALEAAKAAGEILIENFETALDPDVKPDKTFVTQVDTDCEKIIIKTIKETFPDHDFLGEEGGETGNTSPYKWVIDPLDGTANFINAIPIFSTSIALTYEGEIVVGVVLNPVTSSMFYASKGQGAFWNGNTIRVSNNVESNVVATIGNGSAKENSIRKMNMVPELYGAGLKVRLLGSAALELAFLARGGTEAYINFGSKPWDYYAGLIIAMEAGATVTKLDGSPRGSDNDFVATNGKVHDKVVALTSKI